MEPTYLYPSRMELSRWLFFGLIGILTGYALISEIPKSFHYLSPGVQHSLGWFIAFAGVLFILAGVVNFSHRVCFLKLDNNGMTAATLLTSLQIEWVNVKNVRSAKILVTFPGREPRESSRKWVTLDLFDPADIKYNSPRWMHWKSPEAQAAGIQKMYNVDALLPHHYGLTTDAMADLLNEWRVRRQGSTFEVRQS